MLKKLKLLIGTLRHGKGDSRMMSFDLYYQLAYMSTVAASGVPRDQIFARSAEIQCTSLAATAR